MVMSDEANDIDGWGIDRRGVLRGAAAAGAIGVFGLPAVSGSAAAATSSMTVRSGTSTQVVGYRAGDESGTFPTATPNEPADLTWVHPSWSGTSHDFDTDTRWIWHCDESSSTDQTVADVYDSTSTDPTYYVKEPRAGDVAEFKTTFNIPGAPSAGDLYITADNGYEVWINGTPVGSRGVFDVDGTDWEDSDLTNQYIDPQADTWDTVETFNVASLLTTGSNTLTVFGGNAQYSTDSPTVNPGGVIYELDIEYETCTECSGDLLEKYEFACTEMDDDECVAWDFVLESGDDPDISYTPGSFTSKEGEDYEPMAATFETSYCDLYVLVKSGQDLEVQSFEDIDGSFTVETANDGKYAISFVAIYCDEQDALDAHDAWESRGGGPGGSDRGR